MHTGWVRQHTLIHTAHALPLCALKFQFLCLKVKERTKGRRKTAGNCCQSSHRNWKFLYKLQLLCYNIPFHNCLSHMPRLVLLFCAFAWRQFRCVACIIVSKWTDCALTHIPTSPQTNAQLCSRVCVSGSVRVCVCVWHKHVFIVYASARHLNIWDTLLTFRLYTICEYLNVYHISIFCRICRRGILFFVVVFSSLPKMINNFSLCFAFTFYVKLQGHRVHSCVAPFINTCKFLAYLSPDTHAHTHAYLMPSSTLASPFLSLENENKL